jgi:galactofuranose transport system ATP-binding protein
MADSSLIEEPLLQVSGVVKRFPGMIALDHVDFTLQKGEVHGLMGENGAGKSTLLKVITGAQSWDEGQCLLEGVSIRPSSPQQAAALGISTVYQEVNLSANLSVAECICLGTQMGIINWGQMKVRSDEVLDRLGLKLDVRKPLSYYSLAIQQLVAIGRAVLDTPKVLVLDEPTSSLDVDEVQQVFHVIRKLAKEGIGIIFVSHFLGQVYDICDRLTILRNGQVVGTGLTEDISREQLISLMVGHELSSAASVRPAPIEGESRLIASELGKRASVDQININPRRGEVFGLTGLLGSGRSETLNLLFGSDKSDQGRLMIDDQETSGWNCRKAIRRGLGFCPEDRKKQAIIPGLSVRDNIMLALQASRPSWSPISFAQQKTIVDEMVAALQIRTTDIEKQVQHLSGGNQQKCMLARWLIMKPEILLLDEPTRGVDVGAKEEILKLIQELCAQGMTLVVADSELQEIVQIAHRVAVLRDRKMVGILEGDDVTQELIVAKMAEEPLA